MSLGVHRGLELLVGLTILAVPLVLSATTTEVGGAGVAVCVALGALVTGAALHAEDAPSLHSRVDRLLLAALLAGALVLMLVGESVAAACCLAGGVAELGLALPTRYVVRSRGR
jgi:hypothetical protein